MQAEKTRTATSESTDTSAQEKLDELKAQHGDILVANTKYGKLYFKTPTQGDHERWLDKFAKGEGTRPAVTREYVLSALVFPSVQEATAIFAKQAAIPPRIADKLSELAGSELELDIKKA